MPDVIGVIPAAGTGSRLGGVIPKQFMQLAGRAMIDHAIAALLADARVGEVHIILNPGHENHGGIAAPGAGLPGHQAERIVLHRCGGESRAATVAAAAALLSGRGESLLAIHDAARPCLHPEDLGHVLDAALEGDGTALLAEPLSATLKREEGGRSASTIEREGKWLAQTPQIAPAGLLAEALPQAPDVTDEAGALERRGIFPRLVASRHPNPKITTPADLAIAEAIISARQRLESGHVNT